MSGSILTILVIVNPKTKQVLVKIITAIWNLEKNTVSLLTYINYGSILILHPLPGGLMHPYIIYGLIAVLVILVLKSLITTGVREYLEDCFNDPTGGIVPVDAKKPELKLKK